MKKTYIESVLKYSTHVPSGTTYACMKLLNTSNANSVHWQTNACILHGPHSVLLSVSFVAILCITTSEMKALSYE